MYPLEEETMKWRRLLFALAVIGFLGACGSPTIPRFPDPDPDEDNPDPDPPPTQGAILSSEGLFFV